MSDIILPLHLYRSIQIASLWNCWWIKWSLQTACYKICTKEIFRCSLSTRNYYTRDGSLDDVVSHCKYTPPQLQASDSQTFWYRGCSNLLNKFQGSQTMCIAPQYSRKVYFDIYLLLLSDNFKNDIVIVPVWTVRFENACCFYKRRLWLIAFCFLTAALVWILPKTAAGWSVVTE
jgi:hypothetical protein